MIKNEFFYREFAYMQKKQYLCGLFWSLDEGCMYKN